MSPPSSAYVSCHDAYGPAISATRYVERISVVAKRCTPFSTGSATALEITFQSSGAVTVSV